MQDDGHMRGGECACVHVCVHTCACILWWNMSKGRMAGWMYRRAFAITGFEELFHRSLSCFASSLAHAGEPGGVGVRGRGSRIPLPSYEVLRKVASVSRKVAPYKTTSFSSGSSQGYEKCSTLPGCN